MKGKILLLIAMFAFCGSVFSQFTGKIDRLQGKWRYKEGSGFEVWEKKGSDLVGYAYRVNPKTGDSSKVEDIRLRLVNKRLIYTMTTYNYADDSLYRTDHDFVGGKRQMKFYNIDSSSPYMVKYSYGFLNRNKLIIRIYNGMHEKPLKLILRRE